MQEDCIEVRTYFRQERRGVLRSPLLGVIVNASDTEANLISLSPRIVLADRRDFVPLLDYHSKLSKRPINGFIRIPFEIKASYCQSELTPTEVALDRDVILRHSFEHCLCVLLEIFYSVSVMDSLLGGKVVLILDWEAVLGDAEQY